MSKKSPSKNELMKLISKEGHSFPHYNTCKTCEDDFDTITKWSRNQALNEVEKIIDKTNICCIGHDEASCGYPKIILLKKIKKLRGEK